jgi:hypothetical protein
MINFIKKIIIIIKSYLLFYFKIFINIPNIINILYNIKNNNKNDNLEDVTLILAAGTSSRFENETVKQLFIINNKSIIRYSIELFLNITKSIVIVTNSKCYNEINDIIKIILSLHFSIDYYDNLQKILLCILKQNHWINYSSNILNIIDKSYDTEISKKWREIKTDNMSSTLPMTKTLPKSAQTLISHLNNNISETDSDFSLDFSSTLVGGGVSIFVKFKSLIIFIIIGSFSIFL